MIKNGSHFYPSVKKQTEDTEDLLFSHKVRSNIQGAVSQKILRLRYTLGTSSSSWSNTISAILCQQTIVTTTSNHS